MKTLNNIFYLYSDDMRLSCLIYGVCYDYNHENFKEINKILPLIVPDLIAEYHEDVWSCFDDNPHKDGYYCLDFSGGETAQLFIACYFHEHPYEDVDAKEVTLPSIVEMEKFKEWCVNNGINKTPKFYTKQRY